MGQWIAKLLRLLGFGGHRNHTWIRPLALTPGRAESDTIDKPYRSRWYVLRGLRPGDDVTVTLTDCAVDYTLLGFTDIRQKAEHLLALLGTTGPLDADDMDSDDMDSDDMDSDDMDSDDMDSDDMDSDDMDSDDMDSDDMDSDDMDSDDMDSDDMDSEDRADYQTTRRFDTQRYRDVYAGAQRHSLRSASVTPGPADEQIHMTARAGGGNLYFRVRGHHHAAAPGKPFKIVATVDRTDLCADMDLTPLDLTVPPDMVVPKGTRTLILTHTGRVTFGEGDARAQFGPTLTRLAQHPKVKGVVYDLVNDHRLDALYAAWGPANTCVPLANAIVGSIHSLIVDFAKTYPELTYVVLVGGDHVIPFARIEDRAEISREWQWAGFYNPQTPLGATLTYGCYLSDDYYGRREGPLDPRGKSVRAPDLAVGRLVESATDILAYIDKFLRRDHITITSALSGGYTFVNDLAENVQRALEHGGTGVTVDGTFIRKSPPQWTAPDLSRKLGTAPVPWQLVAMQGHYNANTLLPADATFGRMLPDDQSLSGGNIDDALWMTIGCHSGHNIVDSEMRHQSTAAGLARKELSWPEALMARGTTLIGGTGYQYAESDLPENSERMYIYLAEEIARASAVPIGEALNEAKRRYLRHCHQVRGMDEKLVQVATLYGLPMLTFGVPRPQEPATRLIAIAPGALAGIPADRVRKRVVSVDGYPLTPQLTVSGEPYVDTGEPHIVRPLKPVLPGLFRDLSQPGTIPVGVVWSGGHYADSTPTPHVAVPFTEEPVKKPRYHSRAFLPVRPFRVSRVGGVHTLVFAPLQVNMLENTGRQWSDAELTVYYHGHTTPTDATAFHDAPAIQRPALVPALGGIATDVSIVVRHHGSAAETVEAFVSYFIGGALRTDPLTGDPSIEDGIGWLRAFHLRVAVPSADLRVFFQVAGGNGRVSSLTNGGHLFAASAAAPRDTKLSLQVVTAAGYRDRIVATATLTYADDGKPVAGEVLFRLRGSRVWEPTQNGVATAPLTVATRPGKSGYLVVATFPGSDSAAAVSASSELTVGLAGTRLYFPVVPDLVNGRRTHVCQLQHLHKGSGLGGRALIVTAKDQERVVYTDPDGWLSLEPANLGSPGRGLTEFGVAFEGDERYQPTSKTVKVKVT